MSNNGLASILADAGLPVGTGAAAPKGEAAPTGEEQGGLASILAGELAEGLEEEPGSTPAQGSGDGDEPPTEEEPATDAADGEKKYGKLLKAFGKQGNEIGDLRKEIGELRQRDEIARQIIEQAMSRGQGAPGDQQTGEPESYDAIMEKDGIGGLVRRIKEEIYTEQSQAYRHETEKSRTQREAYMRASEQADAVFGEIVPGWKAQAGDFQRFLNEDAQSITPEVAQRLAYVGMLAIKAGGGTAKQGRESVLKEMASSPNARRSSIPQGAALTDGEREVVRDLQKQGLLPRTLTAAQIAAFLKKR